MKININDEINFKLKIVLKKTAAFLFIVGGITCASCKSNTEDTKPTISIYMDICDNTVNDTILEDNIMKEVQEEKTISIEEPSIEDTRKVVALTFDDGPGKYTDRLLDVLKENDAKATFFVLGCNVKRNSEVVKRAYDEGHQIVRHNNDHWHCNYCTSSNA